MTAGREDIAPGVDRPRHRHLEPYAIVVIRGGFEQTSYAGRVRAFAGDLVVQPTLDCHANRLLSRGARILRLPWPDVEGFGGVYPLRDLDAVVRAAEGDVDAAARLAASFAQPARSGACDWPDLLAADLAADRVAGLAEWAEQIGVARETVSRGFTTVYGVPARRFRAELRARAAWLGIVRTDAPLVAIALAAGFADQAHMTRNVRALTGRSPAAWRGHRRTASFRESRRVLID